MRSDSPNVSDRVKGVLVIEFVALAIALVTPITPSKTGSTWTPADPIWPDPTYLQKAAASFVAVNFLILVLGLAAWAALKYGGSK
ncbi:MAG: hypothetical protein KJO06_12950 [Gemmatimonadetes bacterium]|nr:hypothetical protein [Gemmatimonadota bacterium]